jgi:hypothetical protein
MLVLRIVRARVLRDTRPLARGGVAGSTNIVMAMCRAQGKRSP